MIRRREWRTLTAMLHVVLSKFVHDGPTEGICHALTVAELPGSTLLRRVQYGLAVKSYDIDCGQIYVPPGTQRSHCLTVQISHLAFYARHVGAGRRKAQERATQIVRVPCARMGADSQMSLPIRFENRCVNTVHRCATHQSNGPESTRCAHVVCSAFTLSWRRPDCHRMNRNNSNAPV
jgi:hypothetical protein